MKKNVFLTGFAALTMCGITTLTAQVGINTDTPTTTLDIVQPDSTANPGHGFRLRDGNEDEGKVLTSDNGGTGTWQQPGIHMIDENPYDTNYVIDSIPLVANTNAASGHNITLPPGRWKVDFQGVLSTGVKIPVNPLPDGYWAWTKFVLTNTPAAPTPTTDVDPNKQLVSILYVKQPNTTNAGSSANPYRNFNYQMQL